jgi:hypothetical protein
MSFTLRGFALTAAVVALAGAIPGPAGAQGKVDHPRLRAALHEMRDARQELKSARDEWPPGYQKRALQSLNDAIESVRKILAVKDVSTFRGVDRKPDYYKRYRDHRRLRAALDSVREAREELRSARADFRGLKDRALDDLDIAAGDIVVLIRSHKRR